MKTKLIILTITMTLIAVWFAGIALYNANRQSSHKPIDTTAVTTTTSSDTDTTTTTYQSTTAATTTTVAAKTTTPASTTTTATSTATLSTTEITYTEFFAEHIDTTTKQDLQFPLRLFHLLWGNS